MKRLSLFIIITLISTTIIQAQNSTVRRVATQNYDQSRRSDVLGLQYFDNQLDKFSYSLMVNDVWAADRNKSKILDVMNREIRETRKELEILERGSNWFSKRDDNYRQRNTSIYSKNNGTRSRSFEARLLVDRLELQIKLRNRFEDTRLINRRNNLVNEQEHRSLMYRFRDILIQELDNSGNNRNRRG